jgi:hypothetical protein
MGGGSRHLSVGVEWGSAIGALAGLIAILGVIGALVEVGLAHLGREAVRGGGTEGLL